MAKEISNFEPMNVGEWDSGEYKAVSVIIKKLLQASAIGEAVPPEAPRYPVLDLYTGIIHAPGGRKLMLEPSSHNYFADKNLQKEILQMPVYEFLHKIGEMLAKLNGFEKAKAGWVFTKKEKAAASEEEKYAEMYCTCALIEFFVDGYKKSKFEGAKGRSSLICEGRTSSDMLSRIELFDAAMPLFNKLYSAWKPDRLPDFEEYEGTAAVRGYNWREYFNEMAEIYNNSLLAYYPKNEARLVGIDLVLSDKELEGASIGAVEENVKNKYIHWITFSLLCDYFGRIQAKSIGNYRHVLANYENIIAEFDRVFNKDLGNANYLEFLSKSLDYIEENRKGKKLELDDLGELKKAERVFLETNDELEKRLADLQRDLRALLEIGGNSLCMHRQKISTDAMKGFVEAKIAQLRKVHIEINLSPKEIGEIVEKTVRFIEVLLYPLEFLIVSYAALSIVLSKYKDFLQSVILKANSMRPHAQPLKGMQKVMHRILKKDPALAKWFEKLREE